MILIIGVWCNDSTGGSNPLSNGLNPLALTKFVKHMEEHTLLFLMNQVLNTANYIYQYAKAHNLEDSQEYITYQDNLNLLSVIYSEEAQNRNKNAS